MNIPVARQSYFDETTKGVPGGTAPFELHDVCSKKWRLLDEDLPLPCAVLKASALRDNAARMRSFLEATGTVLCPHGKTYMSPQISYMQLRDGAWGITAATVNQVQVFRRYGIGRIFLANQLVGRQNLRWILDELAANPTFDFYCLVDSLEGVRLLVDRLRGYGLSRPLQVLLEAGHEGARTGARTTQAAMEVAREVASAHPHLALVGVECYEGILRSANGNVEEVIQEMFDSVAQVANQCDAENLFARDTVILSGGGSSYYDLAAAALNSIQLSRDTLVVLRSGCYLTHDAGMIEAAYDRMRERSHWIGSLPRPHAALEVWAYIQSRPEPTRAFATMGRRDVSADAGYPVPQYWFRPGQHHAPHALESTYSVVQLNDQHAYLEVPESSPLRVGDMIGFGISHPCTTFDKWRLMYLVNDDYEIIDAIETFF